MFEIQNGTNNPSLLSRVEHHREKLLIVDKDSNFANFLIDYFSRYGYEVTTADDANRAIRLVGQSTFDTVLVDMVTPGMDSFQILRKIRDFSEVPVILLSEFQDETDTILGLEMGADDILKKNLSPRELLARLRAIIRRSAKHSVSSVAEIKVGYLVINLVNRTARESGRELKLTTVEFDLLATLAHNKGQLRTRQQLLSGISDRDYKVTDRSIDVHISSIRRKLNDSPSNPRFIRTVRAIGYILLDPEPRAWSS
ncbi:MAG: response regulator transcription factor [Candidatus Obscuribacterales bacterium]|nr:response regulator transcription factor [Candidatus Obscuribacterales bacterium]